MTKPVNSFLGDTFGRVIFRLLVLSLIVGIVMSILGWSPFDLVRIVYNFFLRLWNMGFSAFRQLFDILLAGALIVVPVFLVVRLLKGWR